jgi:hypothetical protein
MTLFQGLILFSSISFIGYGIHYFTSTKMKNEFIRFGLGKYGTLTAILEIAGGVGLLVGLLFIEILVFSSAGLAILMFLGVGVRFKVKDGLIASLPAIFYFVLNTYLFLVSLQLFLND